MNTGDAILKRRSIRRFKPDKISRSVIDRLLEAGFAAPSACNRRPYEIYVITNEELLGKLNDASRFSNMPSPLSIVVAADLERALPRQYRDYWVQDCSAVTENILLMATELGLGSCWNGLYPNPVPEENVRAALGLKETVVPLSLIRLGYPDEEKTANGGYDGAAVHFFE